MQNTFANEAFFDEIAAELKADPLELRVKYADPSDKRGLEVLERLAKLAKWEKRPSPQKNTAGNIVRGRGVSYVKYELVRTYVGVVAEVEVDRISGNVRVTKFYVVHDCGQIINPNGVKAQIEGNIIQTVSRTLKEEITFDSSMITSLDWANYPILTFPDVPEIVIELIDQPTEKPWGAGEPTAALVSSAISNAVFDATGARTPLGAVQAGQSTHGIAIGLKRRRAGWRLNYSPAIRNGGRPVCRFLRGQWIADGRQFPRLLRARRKRPSCRCAAEKRYELAPLHGPSLPLCDRRRAANGS